MSETNHEKKPRAWQRMLSGRRLDLLEPDPADIAIEDIAHGLARVARWNGQTAGNYPFSVAQHSLVVEDIAITLNPELARQDRLATLLHDAPEYVIGDLISPFKAAIGLDYKAFEKRLLGAIYARFGLSEAPSPAISATIKHADRVAAFFEATVLAGFAQAEAEAFFGRPELPAPLSARLSTLEPFATNTAEQKFLERFSELGRSHD